MHSRRWTSPWTLGLAYAPLTSRLRLVLAPGGGQAMRIRPAP